MSKKSKIEKESLGKQIKRSRRIPVLAMVRTHRRIEQNLFSRNWRKTKLNIKDD